MKQDCLACILEDKKVRVSNPPPHVCAKSRKDYVAPEMKKINVSGGKRKFYKIFIYDIKYRGDKAFLFRLEHQFLNGYSVKRFAELWIPLDLFQGPENRGLTNWIWVHQKFYSKLVFV